MRYLITTLLLALAIAACGPVSDSSDGGRSDGGGADGGRSDGGGSDGGATDGGSDGGAVDAGSSDGGASDGGSTDGGGPGPSPDEETFERILAGALPAADGLLEISASGGWPIETATGFLFARLDDGGGPYALSGDHNAWGRDAMQLDFGVWWVRVAIASPDGSKYKFVDPADGFAADPYARRYGYDEFGEYSLVRATAAHLERWLEVGQGVIAPRRLRIWVPAGSATHHLYAHDGQNLFDPSAPFGGWRLQEVLGASTLVVGIDNAGAARVDEYTHVVDDILGAGGRGDDHADYVMDTVRTLVESEYGVPVRRGVMGSSLGGVISVHTWLRYPTDFHFVASLSGTMGWGSMGTHTGQTLIERLDNRAPDGTVLYLDSGGTPGSGCVDTDADGIEDDTPDSFDNYCTNRQLADQLAADGWTWDSDLFHWWEPDAPHNESAWAARVFRPVDLFEAQ